MSRWNTVAIYGVGLIGGSIGMALRSRRLAGKVVGIGRDPGRLSRCVALGAIDEFVTEVEKLPSPDVVVLCTPVQLLAEHCQAVAKYFPQALITDAGSTKQKLVQQIEADAPQALFVGSHPLAGSDKSGVDSASSDLFEGRTVILTPTAKSNLDSVAGVSEFWQSLGAEVVSMDIADHDKTLAMTSHLPHIVASALAAETPEFALSLVAGGWRDTTRIAAADVEMWTQILQENNQNVLEVLEQLQVRLKTFQSALSDNNRESIKRLLTAGKQRRDALGS